MPPIPIFSEFLNGATKNCLHETFHKKKAGWKVHLLKDVDDELWGTILESPYGDHRFSGKHNGICMRQEYELNTIQSMQDCIEWTTTLQGLVKGREKGDDRFDMGFLHKFSNFARRSLQQIKHVFSIHGGKKVQLFITQRTRPLTR